MKAFIIALFLGVASAQNCGIVDHTGDTVQMGTVLETIEPGTQVWRADTYNVTAAAAIQHPHARYLQGLRYPSRYEYNAAEVFGDFITTERTDVMLRHVVFTCNDGNTRQITFHLNVTDENTEGPVFASRSYNASISKTDNSTEPHTANIIVSDADYEFSNAQIIVRSSNAIITPFVDPTWNGTHPDAYVYKVDFFVNNNASVGRYDVILTADDGKGSDYTILSLEVTE